MPSAHRVSIVLGSGGARGYAHIGAIQVLEERGFEIAGIAGSSMGALVGGLQAAGALEDFADWALTLRQVDVLRLLDVSLGSPGAIRAERIFARVRALVGDRAIENLPVPFTAVATDLVARREVWFQRGSLEAAIRASIALPGILAPVVLDGRMLVDGGLVDPVPVSATAAVPADATIAISLGGERQGRTESAGADPGPFYEWFARFRHGAAQALDTDVARSLLTRFGSATDVAADEAGDAPRATAPLFEPLPSDLTKFDVMQRSLEATQDVVTRYRLASFPPDVLITVPQDVCGTLDFHRARPMIELGRALTAAALDDAGLTAAAR